MDDQNTNIIDTNIDLCILWNPTGLETTTRDTEQTVDADATINLGGASSYSSIDDSTPNYAANNTYGNDDNAINKAMDATMALKLLCIHLVITAKKNTMLVFIELHVWIAVS